MATAQPQTEAQEILVQWTELLSGTSESNRDKTAETFLELLGARVRNPNTRRAYRVAWRSFLSFCSARKLELEGVKAYHVGAWLDRHPGSRSTQRQHLAAVRLLFDHLMMRGVVEYNPAARAKPPRLVRESSPTPVFEEAEIVTFLVDKSEYRKRHPRPGHILCTPVRLVPGFCARQLNGCRLLRTGWPALVAVPRKAGERTRGSGAFKSQRSNRSLA